jgi:dolichol-phosphate mannosyltransferase
VVVQPSSQHGPWLGCEGRGLVTHVKQYSSGGSTDDNPRITVVVPAFNEALVIRDFVALSAASLPEGSELLVVDDGSTDATPHHLAELCEEFDGLRVMSHDANRGIGAALATGFRAASGDVIVTMDADLSHPFPLVTQLVDACRVADAAYGSRYVPGGAMQGVPLWRVLISRGANSVMRVAFRTSVRDLTTGMRAFRRDAVRDLRLDATGFEAQLEITVRLLAGGRRIDEVPMVLRNRSVGESKMRYLRLAPRYARTFVRMLGVRWAERFQAGR